MGFGRCWCPGHPAVLSPQQALWEEAGPPRRSHADPEGAALGSPGTRGRGRDGATPGPPCCGVAPSPDHSPLATPQGPSEAVATVKPVTGGGYQPRAPTGRPAATRPPGITGGFGAEGGGISSSPIALGGWEQGQLCSILMESCCARLNPLCAPPRASVSPGGEGLPGTRGGLLPPLCSLRVPGAPLRGAAGPDPAPPVLQPGLLHLPRRAVENVHPQGGAGLGGGRGTWRGQQHRLRVPSVPGQGWCGVGAWMEGVSVLLFPPGRFSTPRRAATTRCCSTSSSGR